MKKLLLFGVFVINLLLAGCVEQASYSPIHRVAALRPGMTVAQVHHHIPAQDRMGVQIDYRKSKHLVEYVNLMDNNTNKKNIYMLVYQGHKHPRLKAWGFVRNLQRDKDRSIRIIAQKAADEATVLHKGARRELAQYITNRRAQYLGTESVLVQGQNIDVDYYRDNKSKNIYFVTYNYQGKVLAFGYPSDFRKSKQSFTIALGKEAMATYQRT